MTAVRNWCCQGQSRGRWRSWRRELRAIRPGRVMRYRRSVLATAVPWVAKPRVATQWIRLRHTPHRPPSHTVDSG